VQGAAFKALRVALFADRMLNDENALSEKSDHNLLAWSNSLRLDLVALGLERREKATIDLASYLAREAGRGPETTADAARTFCKPSMTISSSRRCSRARRGRPGAHS
jgi:DUF1680 family protein